MNQQWNRYALSTEQLPITFDPLSKWSSTWFRQRIEATRNSQRTVSELTQSSHDRTTNRSRTKNELITNRIRTNSTIIATNVLPNIDSSVTYEELTKDQHWMNVKLTWPTTHSLRTHYKLPTNAQRLDWDIVATRSSTIFCPTSNHFRLITNYI